MKLSYPGIRHVFDTDIGRVNSLVIENRQLLCELICDLKGQVAGGTGSIVVSNNDNVLNIKKTVEVIDQFVPFSINKKTILGKLQARLFDISQNEDHFIKANEILNELERFLDALSFESGFNIEYDTICWDALIKAVGVRASEEYSCVSDALVQYFDIVNSFEGKKLFVLINLRSYISNEEAGLFFTELINRNIPVITIESFESEKLVSEKRYIVDESLCEIDG